MASERGPRANRGGFGPPGLWDRTQRGYKAARKRNGLGGPAEQGKSPVRGSAQPAVRHPSTAGHVKPGGNQGGPPSNPEYSPVTDSARVPRGKGEKHPGRGVKQYLKPPAYKQSEHLLQV